MTPRGNKMAAVLARGQVQSFYFCRASPFWTDYKAFFYYYYSMMTNIPFLSFCSLYGRSIWTTMMDSTCSQGRATPPSHLPIIKCFTEREVDSVSFSFQAIIIQQPVLLAGPPLRRHVSQRNHRVLEEGGRGGREGTPF